MKVGIIGSGVVGQTLGAKLAGQGHSVVLGTRDPSAQDKPKGMAGMGAPLGEWLKSTGHGARIGTFADAAAHGEVIVHATSGTVAVEALTMAGKEHLKGKVLIDVANILDFSHGMPPACGARDAADGSVGEAIQRAFPDARVVKTLNTMSAWVMVDPKQLADGDHTVFLSGNDASAKGTVRGLLEGFGWKDIVDLGGIETARGPEMYFALWARCWPTIGNRPFNIKLVR